MNRTPIEWTDFSANPVKYRAPDGRVVWACVKKTPGCKECYAAAMAERFTQRRAGDWNASVMATLTPFIDEHEVRMMLTHEPAAGHRCFVGDMTDVFGTWVPDELLDQLFAVFALRGKVTWQVLTKTADRMRAYLNAPTRRASILQHAIRIAGDVDGRPEGGLLPTAFELEELWARDKYWPIPNVWLGVSCEDQQRAEERIPELLQTPAAIRFISAEPLLAPLHLKQQNPDGFWPPNAPQPDVAWLRHKDWPNDFQYWTTGLDWVIVGGESGPGARPCDVQAVRSIVRQCRLGRVAVFVKQLGANARTRNDDEFDGHDDRAWPEHIESEDRVEHNPNGYREEHQGAEVRVRFRSRKGNDPLEWPPAMRVREFPGFPEARTV